MTSTTDTIYCEYCEGQRDEDGSRTCDDCGMTTCMNCTEMMNGICGCGTHFAGWYRQMFEAIYEAGNHA